MAQGAAFDANGRLWVAASNSKFGALSVLEPSTGKADATYDMVIGIEDLGFDSEGKLWSLSEAGSLRWSKWSKSFPMVFQVETAKLK